MLIKDVNLYNHLALIVANVVEVIQNDIKGPKHLSMSRYYDWPKQTSGFPNGMPSFSKHYSIDSGPIDYKKLFDKWRGTRQIEYASLPGWSEYEDYAYKNEYIRKKFYMLSIDGDDKYFIVHIHLMFEYLVDRYFHLYGLEEGFDKEKFKEIYIPIENYIMNDSLEVELVFPLLFLKFDFDTFEISENILLKRMEENFQLARTTITNYGVPVNKTAVNSTTHALILKHYTMENTPHYELSNSYTNENFYPTEKPDLFINCLRIVLGVETGYAQLIINSVGWADNYQADLPNINGTLKRAYPLKFDDFYWLNPDVPTISFEKMKMVSDIFKKAEEISSPKLEVAMNRLHYCYLRDSEEDAVIDAMIALETILSDGEKSELNHKLAMRISALFSLDPNIEERSKEVFMTVKKIYDYRSSIVHGSSRATVNKKREVKIEGHPAVPVVIKAIEYLRKVIFILIEHPEFLEAKKIDEEILLKNL